MLKDFGRMILDLKWAHGESGVASRGFTKDFTFDILK